MTKPPVFFSWLLGRLSGRDGRYAVPGDLEEEFHEIAEAHGMRHAVRWYRLQALKALPQIVVNSIEWSFIMFRNYMKIALRNLQRHKGYSFINIFGLAAGLACCIFILLYVRFEMSYDSFHQDVDRMYMVNMIQKTPSGTRYSYGNLTGMGKALRDDYPQVEEAVRITSWSGTLVRCNNKIHYEDGVMWAEPEIFSMFSIEFIEGDPNTAINRPKTAVMSEQMAAKYFGHDNPVGSTVKVDTTVYEITGIVKDAPQNTHIKYNLILSWLSIESIGHMREEWHPLIAATHTYVKLKQGVDAVQFENQISRVAHRYNDEELKKESIECFNKLLPVRDIHLRPDIGGGTQSGPLKYIYTFSGAGIFILLIACMNFMNLSTARSSNRACEVGMRKVVGAQRRQLVWQFLGESTLLALIALVAAVGIAFALLPVFNELTGIHFTVTDLLNADILAGMFALVLFVGIAAGSYPAFFLSAFRPVSMLKGTLSSGSRGALMRKFLVVGQFAISITLMIGTIVVFRQITFMKNQPLGFDREQKFVIKLSAWDMMAGRYDVIKNEFRSHPAVKNVSIATGVPGRMINHLRIYPSDEGTKNSLAPRCLRSDQDFISAYNLEIIAGRNFSHEITSDAERGVFILNESAVRALGWESPITAVGKEIWDRRIPVVGVVKDFHWYGLQNAIEPMVIRCVPSMARYITLTLDTTDLNETLAFIEKKYRVFFPDDIYDFFFLDTDFDNQYRFEEKIGRIFGVFTLLGMTIACLGLFGLASFIAEQRTKEVGIRKALGAKVSNIVTLMTKEFVKWVIFSTVVAWPAGYFIMDLWLRGFAYRIRPELLTFAAATVITLIIALLTVGAQAYKAARTNPIDSLRYE